MIHGKIFFHVAANCGGCSGIGEMFRALDAAGAPFAVYSANDPGLLVEAAQYPNATLIYRDVEASTVNPSDYAADPLEMAAVYWQRTLGALPESMKALKGRVWLELLNEPGKEGAQADWVGRLMLGMGLLALAEGRRVCGPGWSAGTPEPYHWRTPGWRDYLKLCAANPDRLAVSLHEYSLDNSIHAGEAADGSKWLVGRFEHLFAACDEMKLARPTVFITEAGWTLNSMPGEAQAKRDIQYLSQLYAAHPQVKAAFLWTLQAGQGNGDLPQRLNALMLWLTRYVIQPDPPLAGEPAPPTPEPEPQPPQPSPTVPPVPPINRLNNSDFEDGWYHPDGIPELQIPAGWEVKWRDGNDPGWANPFDAAPHARFVRPEIRTLPAAQLPAAEQPLFVRDGVYTVKSFKGGGAWYATFMQTVELPAGKWRLVTPVYADLVADYNGGVKVFSADPNAGLWRARVGPVVVSAPSGVGAFGGGWMRLAAGQWNEPAAEFETKTAGPVEVKIDFLLPFPLRQNGIFTDAWTLTADGAVEPEPDPQPEPEPPPAPARHKAIVVKLPQSATADEWRQFADLAFTFRHTITASLDDMLTVLRGGNPESYVKLALPGRQPDVAALIEAGGYRWEPFPNSPLTGLKLGHPFAWRYALTSPFDAPREYGNGRHEGADYDVVGGAPDNKVDVLCLYPGVVVGSSDGTTGYGRQVRVRHTNNGQVFYTRYAHLDRRYVAVGEVVGRGEPLGEVGATGNATGEHVHINLEAPGFGKSGYVVDGVVDPALYLPAGANLLPRYIPPAAGEKIDLLPYLKGDGRLYEVRHIDAAGNEGQERFQTQAAADNVFYQTKNAAWEEFRYDDAYIWRGMDTSPGPDKGRDRFYIQAETALRHARWCPRYMVIGQSWVGPGHHVQFYDKATCAKLADFSGAATNRITLVARHAAISWSWNGITVADVVELTNGSETWFFGRGYGLVAWQSAWGRSAIVEAHQPGARPDNVREVIPCLP